MWRLRIYMNPKGLKKFIFPHTGDSFLTQSGTEIAFPVTSRFDICSSFSQGSFIMFSRRLCLHLEATLKVVVCLTVLVYLSWTYRHNLFLFTSFMTNPDHRACVYRRRNYELQENSSPLYVTLVKHGRLGNWLYGYAALLGIARANGYIPYFPDRHPLKFYFDIKHVKKTDAECLLTVYDNLPCSYAPSMMSLPQGNISIDGYIQSWKYFHLMEAEIRKELKIREEILVEAKKVFQVLVGHYISEKRLVISIHVRRGDVLKPEARKLGFCHAPKEYFDNALKYMAEKFPHSVFLVISDDISWCEMNIKTVTVLKSVGNKEVSEKVPIVYSQGYSERVDFALLTLCNHSVVSVGTFGWWGAWLANGHVVYYKDFPIPGTKVDYETKKEDFFPPHWVALSSSCINYQSLYFVCIALIIVYVLKS